MFEYKTDHTTGQQLCIIIIIIIIIILFLSLLFIYLFLPARFIGVSVLYCFVLFLTPIKRS